MASKFTKNSATFICTCCGHNTRNTGVQSIDSRTCPACWELAGLENALSDAGEEQFIEAGYDEAVKSYMNEIRNRSEAEYAKAMESFESLKAYFPTDAEFNVEAPLLAPVAVVTDHSHAAKPVDVCRTLKAERPALTRKEFIHEAGLLGVCKATAATQFHRLGK